jgi:hypothetical protein
LRSRRRSHHSEPPRFAFGQDDLPYLLRLRIFAILIARTFFIMRRNVDLSAALSVVLAMSS